MFHYQADQLTDKQHYKFLTGSVIPRPIAWITTQNKETEIINAAPFSYFTVISKLPPLISVSINRKNGELKDTARNLLATNEAVVHIVDEQLVKQMNETAASLSPKESELQLIPATLEKSSSVTVPAIKEALIRFETVLYQYVPIKDPAGAIISDLFILEIKEYFFDEQVFDPEKEYVLPEKLKPVSRLAGNFYGTLGNTFEEIRPK